MKITALLFLMSLGCSTISIEVLDQAKKYDPSNLYASALKAYIDTCHFKYNGVIANAKWDNWIIETEPTIAAFIPMSIDRVKIRCLSPQQIIAEYMLNGEKIDLTRIWPMYNQNDTIVVAFSGYLYSNSNGQAMHELYGGGHGYIKYDPESKKFKLVRMILWGV